MGLFTGKRPLGLGVRGGKFRPAPATPNAVSSQADDELHRIAPLAYAGSREAAMAFLTSLVESTPRAAIIVATPDYFYAEFQSRWMGFVDDVEFYFPAYEKIIHVRSASRLGYRDFGVNRRRVERIRRQIDAWQA